PLGAVVLPARGRARQPRAFPTRRSSDLLEGDVVDQPDDVGDLRGRGRDLLHGEGCPRHHFSTFLGGPAHQLRVVISIARTIGVLDRKSTRLNSSHVKISYAVSCLKKKRR